METALLKRSEYSELISEWNRKDFLSSLLRDGNVFGNSGTEKVAKLVAQEQAWD